MKNLKKTIAMVSSVVLAGSAFAACGSNTTTTPATTDAPAATDAAAPAATDAAPADTQAAAPAASGDNKLTVLCWNADDINPMVKTFCEQTSHTEDEFNIQNFGVQGGQAAETYINYFAEASNDADIMFVEADWALQFINDDSAETGTKALSDLGVSNDYSNLYGYTVEIGKSKTGVQKGLSWQAAAGGFCYREDLAEKYLGVTNPDDMQALVSDWKKFEETAAKVKEASNGETALTATIGGVWQVFSAGRSTPWVVDNKVVLDDSAKDYINLAKSMYDNGYVIKDQGQWNDSWYGAGQTDKTMGYFVSTWGFGDAILSQAAGGPDGATYGKWKVCVGPQAFFWGGTWMVAPSRNNSPELTKEFMEFFTVNTEGATAYGLASGDYVSNKEAIKNIIPQYAGHPVLGGQNQFEVLNVVADKIDMTGAITEYDSAVKGNFSDAVSGYCNGTYATVEETIQAFAENTAAALPALDYSNFQ